MTYKYERKLDKKNAYLAFITLALIISLFGNYAQNANYSKVEAIYDEELEVAESTYSELQDEYTKVKNQLDIMTDEYNELLESK